MKNSLRLSALLASLFLIAAFSGCVHDNNRYYVPDADLYERTMPGSNAAGIVNSSPYGWKELKETSLVVRSDELQKRRNVSGDNTTLLWGLFTYADY